MYISVNVTTSDIFRGSRQDPCWNPVARALSRMTHPDVTPMVSEQHAAFVRLADKGDEGTHVDVPEDIRRFLTRYDKGFDVRPLVSTLRMTREQATALFIPSVLKNA